MFSYRVSKRLLRKYLNNVPFRFMQYCVHYCVASVFLLIPAIWFIFVCVHGAIEGGGPVEDPGCGLGVRRWRRFRDA